jgi:hypothetical protein
MGRMIHNNHWQAPSRFGDSNFWFPWIKDNNSSILPRQFYPCRRPTQSTREAGLSTLLAWRWWGKGTIFLIFLQAFSMPIMGMAQQRGHKPVSNSEGATSRDPQEQKQCRGSKGRRQKSTKAKNKLQDLLPRYIAILAEMQSLKVRLLPGMLSSLLCSFVLPLFSFFVRRLPSSLVALASWCPFQEMIALDC